MTLHSCTLDLCFSRHVHCPEEPLFSPRALCLARRTRLPNISTNLFSTSLALKPPTSYLTNPTTSYTPITKTQNKPTLLWTLAQRRRTRRCPRSERLGGQSEPTTTLTGHTPPHTLCPLDIPPTRNFSHPPLRLFSNDEPPTSLTRTPAQTESRIQPVPHLPDRPTHGLSLVHTPPDTLHPSLTERHFGIRPGLHEFFRHINIGTSGRPSGGRLAYRNADESGPH